MNKVKSRALSALLIAVALVVGLSVYLVKLADNGGVYVVPAFTGLGAPHWDMYARGAILGLTRGSGRSHIIRASLESIAYQTRDVLAAMESDIGAPLLELKADGGASAISLVKKADAARDPFEIVYMDMQMPGMDGIDAYNLIKSLPLH